MRRTVENRMRRPSLHLHHICTNATPIYISFTFPNTYPHSPSTTHANRHITFTLSLTYAYVYRIVVFLLALRTVFVFDIMYIQCTHNAPIAARSICVHYVYELNSKSIVHVQPRPIYMSSKRCTYTMCGLENRTMML